jgi:hypothetical protein
MGRKMLVGTVTGLALALAGCAGTTPAAVGEPAAPSTTVTPTAAPAAPVVASSEPSTVPGATASTASPKPSADPDPTTSPAPEACGTTVSAPDESSDTPVWVGNYGGGGSAEPGAPMDLAWSVVARQDWSGRDVTVTVDNLALMPLDAPGVVAAVPAHALPKPETLQFYTGSERGGGGSHASVVLTMPFLSCKDGGDKMPVGVYVATVSLTLDAGGKPVSQQGLYLVFVGGYDAATAATESW